jgi:hypothetical protein
METMVNPKLADSNAANIIKAPGTKNGQDAQLAFLGLMFELVLLEMLIVDSCGNQPRMRCSKASF